VQPEAAAAQAPNSADRSLQAAQAEVLRLREQVRLHTLEKEALQGRAEAAEARVLELERRVREQDAAAGRAEERIADLQRRAGAADGRVQELALQLERAQLGARALDVRHVAQALSGGVSTASHAELAVATGGFAAGHILGRGGFGPVYRGERGGLQVAIKRLDQVSAPPRSSLETGSLGYFVRSLPGQARRVTQRIREHEKASIHARECGDHWRPPHAAMTCACGRRRPRSRASRSCCGR
jgi:hypothetical protein